jgi:hypothetical protein
MKAVARIRSHIIVSSVLAVTVALTGAALTNASWVDNEYVHAGGIGTDGRCVLDSGTMSTATARQLSGTLLGSDLANLASVQGVQVTNDGEGTSTPSPGAIRVNDNTFMAPLDFDLLAADILRLSLPLKLPVGSLDAYSQWSQTLNNGNTTAAGGLVTGSGGAIALGQPQDPANPPVMATVDLGSLVPATLAGMTLSVGSVSSLARLTHCGAIGNGWLGPLDQPLLERAYGISRLDLNAELPALGSAVSGMDQLLNGVQPSLDAAVVDLGTSIVGGLSTAAGPLLGALTLGGVDAQVTVAPVDLASLRALLSSTLTDDRGLLTVELATGTVRVDLAKSVGGATGLNGMGPNSEVIVNQAIVAELSASLAQVLGDWQANITSLLVDAIRGTSVTVNATVHTLAAGIPLADIGLSLGPVSVGHLLDLHNSVPGTPAVPVTTVVTILGLDPLGILTPTVNILASGLASTLASITGKALDDVLTSGIVNAFNNSAAALVGPVADSLATALQPVSAVLSIMVNVQPDQPPYPGPATTNFEVQALRLALINDLNTLNLSLATASVGYRS